MTRLSHRRASITPWVQRFRGAQGDYDRVVQLVREAELGGFSDLHFLAEVYRIAVDGMANGGLANATKDQRFNMLCLKLLRTLCLTDAFRAREFHAKLQTWNVGQLDARTYEVRAAMEARMGDETKAKKLVQEGLRAGAKPQELLQVTLGELIADRPGDETHQDLLVSCEQFCRAQEGMVGLFIAARHRSLVAGSLAAWTSFLEEVRRTRREAWFDAMANQVQFAQKNAVAAENRCDRLVNYTAKGRRGRFLASVFNAWHFRSRSTALRRAGAEVVGNSAERRHRAVIFEIVSQVFSMWKRSWILSQSSLIAEAITADPSPTNAWQVLLSDTVIKDPDPEPEPQQFRTPQITFRQVAPTHSSETLVAATVPRSRSQTGVEVVSPQRARRHPDILLGTHLSRSTPSRHIIRHSSTVSSVGSADDLQSPKAVCAQQFEQTSRTFLSRPLSVLPLPTPSAAVNQNYLVSPRTVGSRASMLDVSKSALLLPTSSVATDQSPIVSPRARVSRSTVVEVVRTGSVPSPRVKAERRSMVEQCRFSPVSPSSNPRFEGACSPGAPGASNNGGKIRGPERFYFDKSTYTGVARFGGPSVDDKENLAANLRPNLNSRNGAKSPTAGSATAAPPQPASAQGFLLSPVLGSGASVGRRRSTPTPARN